MPRIVLLLMLVTTLVSATVDTPFDVDDFVLGRLWCSDRGYIGSGTGYKCTPNRTFVHLLYAHMPDSNGTDDLVLQFAIYPELTYCDAGSAQLIECDLDTLLYRTIPFKIWIVPDVKSVHVIFDYRGKSQMISKVIHCKEDRADKHIYRLVVKSDRAYTLLIDGDHVMEKGTLDADWPVLLSKNIKNNTDVVQEILYELLPAVKKDQLAADMAKKKVNNIQ